MTRAPRIGSEGATADGERRSRFLAAASATLSESLDHQRTLARVAELAVPEFADWCTVRVATERGLERVAVVHADAARGALVREYEALFPASQDGGELGAKAAAGESVLETHLGEAALQAAAGSPDRLRVLRGLGVASCIVVPLKAARRVIGVLSFVRGDGSPAYDEADLALAEDLAGRAALAVENARLFTAERNAREEIQRERDGLRRLVQQAEQAERSIALIANSVPQIVWTHAPDGRTEYVNDRWYEYTGLAREAPLEQASRHVVHPDDERLLSERWTGALAKGVPFETEIRLRRHTDGDYRWHLTRVVPVRDAAGNVVRWVGSSTDIHDRKRSEETSRFMAEASALLGGSLDPESTLKNLAALAVPRMADWCSIHLHDENEPAARQLVVAHKDPAKLKWAEEVNKRYPPDLSAPRGVHVVIRTGEPELYRDIPDQMLVAAAKDEEHLRLLREVGLSSAMTVPLSARGRTFGAISFIATESRKRYDESDLASAMELARRAAMAVENARLYDHAQRAVRVRDDFLSVASHELRTPLTPLHLNVRTIQEALKKGKTDPASLAKFADKLAVVARQVGRLERLVDGILDVSRITGGRLVLDFEQMDLAAHAREVVDRFRVQAEHDGTALAYQGEQTLSAFLDRVRVDQIFTNLVSNALKFGAGKPVTVRVERKDGSALVSVQDRGIGIAPGDQERIFGQFERAVPSRHFGGLGLGLWLTRQIVEAMRGEIRVHSTPGGGSTFTVLLPIASAAAPAPA